MPTEGIVRDRMTTPPPQVRYVPISNLHDWMAGQGLESILGNHETCREFLRGEISAQTIAERAYDLGEAMMLERTKRGIE